MTETLIGYTPLKVLFAVMSLTTQTKLPLALYGFKAQENSRMIKACTCDNLSDLTSPYGG